MHLCPKKDVCGSCSWSHIPYTKQLVQKIADINGSFGLKKLSLQVEEILPSPKTEHYRNRMDFVIDFEGRVGLREKGKWWRVIDGHPCFLGDERIEEIFQNVREWTKTTNLSFYDRKANSGLLRYAVIRATKAGETMLIIVTSAPMDETEAAQIKTAIKNLATTANIRTAIWSINHTISDISFGDELHVITGSGVITETIGGYSYVISPNAFFQTNSHGAELLLSTVKEFAGDLSNKTLLDLYCGSGFFSTALAAQTKRTVGVELNAEAIRDARINAEQNAVHVEYHDARTEEFDWKSIGADVVILDPPRSGMHDKALADVIDVLPKEIIYVSCNPKNFAREMVQLQEFYKVDAIRAVDMFPHTPHVELVSKLIRKSA